MPKGPPSNPYLEALLREEPSRQQGYSGGSDIGGDVSVQMPSVGNDVAFVTKPREEARERLKERWMGVAKVAADRERLQKKKLHQYALGAAPQKSAGARAGWHEVLGGAASVALSNEVVASSYRHLPPSATMKPAALAAPTCDEATESDGALVDHLVSGSLQDFERQLSLSLSSSRYVCSDASSAYCGLDLLSIAAITNNLGAARLLLDNLSARGAGAAPPRINLKSRSERRTPLLQACLKGHVDMAKLLLAEGADPRATDKHGYGCLHLGVMARSHCTVSFLVGSARALKININGRSKSGLSPLMMCRDREVAVCLLGGGADPLAISADGLDYYGILVRCRAARLLEAVLNCNVNRSRPTSIAAASGVESSSSRASSASPLLLACKLNYADCATALMDSYSMSASSSRHISESDENGFTALHHMCINGNDGLLARALSQEQRGWPPLQTESSDGATPLALALLHCHEAAVLAIIAHEGPVCLHRENSAGYTCAEFLLQRHRATNSDSYDGVAAMIRLLVRSGLVLRNRTIFLMCRLTRIGGAVKIKTLCAHGVVEQNSSASSASSVGISGSRCSSQVQAGEFSDSPANCDLVLLSNDGRRLHCCARVLTAASQKLQAYMHFNSSRGGASSESVFLDAPHDLLLLLVQFAYSGTHSLSPLFASEDAGEERVLNLLWLADEFIMPPLVLELEQELCRRLARALRLCRAGQVKSEATHTRAGSFFTVARALDLAELQIVAAFVYLSTVHADSDCNTLADAVDSMLE